LPNHSGNISKTLEHGVVHQGDRFVFMNRTDYYYYYYYSRLTASFSGQPGKPVPEK